MPMQVQMRGIPALAAMLATRGKRQQQRKDEQERKNIEDEMKNLTTVLRDFKEYQELDPSDPMRPLLERKMTLAYGRVPGEFQTPLQQRRRDYVKGVGPDVTGYREQEKIGAPTGASTPVTKPQVPPLRTRLIRLYDEEKKKADALDIQIKGLEMTMPEPTKGVLGIGGNQAEIDSIQAQIDMFKQQRAKIQSNIDRVESEGRKRFGQDIIFGVPPQETITKNGGLMSREEFIQDFQREEGRAPTERDLQMLKGIAWE